MKRRRRLHWIVGSLLLIALAFIMPIASVETACKAPRLTTQPASTGKFAIDDPDYARAATNSVLSYPEWYIVYAYEDFAGVLKSGDEYKFSYLRSTHNYWTGLCAVNRVASAQGETEFSEKVMLYVIGFSFTAEMAVKGAYETTIGHLFAWARGAEKTNEDRFALTVANEYAEFLYQQPWYQYPFKHQVHRLWRDVPFDWSHPVRASERRFALTAEWGVKTVYAAAIAGAAGMSPAPLHLKSVVDGLDDMDLAADPAIVLVRKFGDGNQLIDTPRYGAFTQIARDLAKRDRQFLEIAGNDTIFATVLVPPGDKITLPGWHPIFSDAVQSRPGWRRQGVELAVPDLTKTIQGLNAQGAILEHLYDY